MHKSPLKADICFCSASWRVRGAGGLNIGDDLSGVLSSAPTIDRLCTHGFRLKAADGNRIAKGISPPNDLENIACLTCGILCVYLLHIIALTSNLSGYQSRLYPFAYEPYTYI